MPLKGAFLRVFGVSVWHILGFSTAALASYWATAQRSSTPDTHSFPQK